MTILLVRHAESTGNVDSNAYRTTPDHMIALTDRGHEQAKAAGLFLKDWLAAHPPQNPPRLWCSPYVRTRQTLDGMRAAMGARAWNICGRGMDVQIDDRLRERNWGYFTYRDYMEDSAAMDETHALQREAFHRTLKTPGGMYYAQPYGGDSVADIVDRMRTLFLDIHHDIQNGVTDHIIVTHARAIHAFLIGFTKLPPEYADHSKLVGNTGIHLVDKDPTTNRYTDFGVIYEPDAGVRLLERPANPVA